jgi:type II secretory pathway pseudopilin PulG
MSYGYGRDDRREANKWFGLGLGWWVLIVILAITLTAGIWGLQVATSRVKGQGDAQIQKNSAENWIKAQARFEKNYAEIKATDGKITNAYKVWQDDPTDKTAKQTYTGLQSYCLSVVAAYNADARSYLTEDFRSADLPDQIQTEGPSANKATDCKEN